MPFLQSASLDGPLEVATARLVHFHNAIAVYDEPWKGLPDGVEATVRDSTVTFAQKGTLGFATLDREKGYVLGYMPFFVAGRTVDRLATPLEATGAERIARRAYQATGIPYRLGTPTMEEGNGDELVFRYPLYEGDLRLVGCGFTAEVSTGFGVLKGASIEASSVKDPFGSAFPRRPVAFALDRARLGPARATVGAAAFARARTLGLALDVLDASAEPEPGLWLAERRDERTIHSEPTALQTAAAGRSEGTPVWIVTLRGDAATPEGEAVFPLVTGYVDATTGRLLLLRYVDPALGGFGGGPVAKPLPRPAPLLSGPASLTTGGRTKAVRLVPVAPTRSFRAGGKAVLSLGKRMVEAEVDPKAGLMRYRGRLARTLTP